MNEVSRNDDRARDDAANEVKLQLIQGILDQPYTDAFALQEIRRVLAHQAQPTEPAERAGWVDTGSGGGYDALQGGHELPDEQP